MLKETSTKILQRTNKTVGKPNVCTVHPWPYLRRRQTSRGVRNIKVARRVRTPERDLHRTRAVGIASWIVGVEYSDCICTDRDQFYISHLDESQSVCLGYSDTCVLCFRELPCVRPCVRACAHISADRTNVSVCHNSTRFQSCSRYNYQMLQQQQQQNREGRQLSLDANGHGCQFDKGAYAIHSWLI